ncbi:MAG: hypothetical protein Q4G21_00275 [Dermabacter sp.]|nr:hypothetical protein [Dermabacter sp.]
MESFNVGAVVFALLVGMWLLYAMPNIAERRRVLAESERISALRHSTTARDLTQAARDLSRPREVAPMRHTSQIHRPLDPTARPRFELSAADADLGASVIAPTARSPRVLTAILAVLALATAVLLVTTGFSVTPVWAPLVSCAALFGYVAYLRATRERRALAARLAREAAAPRHVSDAVAAERAAADLAATDAAPSAEPSAAGEDRREAEVENPAQRHEAFLREVMERRRAGEGIAQARQEHSGPATFRYAALSTPTRLEDPELEERENLGELAAPSRAEVKAQVIGGGLTLDEVLERRRA